MKIFPVSAIILTRNEAEMIQACLDTLKWCQEIIVVDENSTDQTTSIAQASGAEVFQSQETSFASRRELAIKKATQPWILYIDADERVTPALMSSIVNNLNNVDMAVGLINRVNFFYGQRMTAGGWTEPAIPRLFRQSALQGWTGAIHESPKFQGSAKKLSGELWHFTHRSVESGLLKTVAWTPMEADLLAANLSHKVGALTVLRKGLGEFMRRVFWHKGYKDGETGVMEGIIQAINRMLVYIQVWERQKHPPITQHYQQLEKEIYQQWQKQQS